MRFSAGDVIDSMACVTNCAGHFLLCVGNHLARHALWGHGTPVPVCAGSAARRLLQPANHFAPRANAVAAHRSLQPARRVRSRWKRRRWNIQSLRLHRWSRHPWCKRRTLHPLRWPRKSWSLRAHQPATKALLAFRRVARPRIAPSKNGFGLRFRLRFGFEPPLRFSNIDRRRLEALPQLLRRRRGALRRRIRGNG